ncbi:MAG: hypothetical protein ABI876_07010 [Bacteroidota bacterium]
MNSIFHGTTGRTLASFGGAMLLAFSLVACNSSLNSPDTTTTADASKTAAEIASDISLTTTATDSLGNALNCHMNGNPSQLWDLAVKLQGTLTDSQKLVLFSRAESRIDSMTENPDSMKCGRHDGDPRHGLQRIPANDMRGNDSAAMGTALGLTDAQQTALYSLRVQQHAQVDSLEALLKAGTIDQATFRAEMDKLRAARDAALATILDAKQLEILKIHDALVVRLHGPGGHGGRDGRPGHR